MKKQNLMGTINEKRLLNIKKVCIYTGIGQTRARQYMDEIGATKQFGRRVLFDKTIIDMAINNK